MARKPENKPMYNQYLKKQFIESKGKTYLGALNALFRKSYILENELNKDLYQFNLEEIEKLFMLVNKKTTIGTYNCIKYYLDYCKQQGFINNNIMATLSPHDFEDIIEYNRFRLNEDDLNCYINECYNVQDKLILQLLFEGVYGKNCSELLNLKIEDISEKNNALYLNCDMNGPRTILVSDKCMELLQDSIKETVFFQKNGKAISGTQIESYCVNDYVIKSLKRKTPDETKRATLLFIISRFKSFKEWFHKDITPFAVFKSGMIKYAVGISKEQGIPIKQFKHEDQWKIVANRYTMKSRLNNGYPQFYNLFQDIRHDEIFLLYGNYLESSFKLIDESNVEKDIIEKKKRNTGLRFKRMMLEAYNGTCAITGETTQAVLEACHIQDFINEDSDHYQNGILLRIDFHRLFDKGLIKIHDDYTVSVSSEVISDYYQSYHGSLIMLPQNKKWLPSKEALIYRIEKDVKNLIC